ncbi:hypothetical protein PG993_007809 [Apiospora rasikravindrae]|uniref:Uncharacterized protein n=1 Tax=Apiospora rasikravindrae TaxID=990691 RepID=A0ABR1SYK0_9PEZI
MVYMPSFSWGQRSAALFEMTTTNFAETAIFVQWKRLLPALLPVERLPRSNPFLRVSYPQARHQSLDDGHKNKDTDVSVPLSQCSENHEGPREEVIFQRQLVLRQTIVARSHDR